MTRKLTRRLFALSLLNAAIVFSLFGQDYKSMLGKWTMTSDNGSDSLQWTLILKETDGKLAAALASEQGEMPAKDLSFTDGVLKFKAPYEGEDYVIELKLVSGKLDGTWSGNGDSGKTTGIRN